jgi:hypothetical protein
MEEREQNTPEIRGQADFGREGGAVQIVYEIAAQVIRFIAETDESYGNEGMQQKKP